MVFYVSAWQPSLGDRSMYDGPDMASTDLPEDHVYPEPILLAPDVSKLRAIQGYTNVGYYANGGKQGNISSLLYLKIIVR